MSLSFSLSRRSSANAAALSGSILYTINHTVVVRMDGSIVLEGIVVVHHGVSVVREKGWRFRSRKAPQQKATPNNVYVVLGQL